MLFHRVTLFTAARRAALAFLLVLVFATPSAGQTLPGDKSEGDGLAGERIQSLRGVLPNQSFLSDGGVESINTANGNLMLSIPLGQVFTVGPHIRYQLRVTNNSDAWDHGPVTQQNILASLPHLNSNAGVGWEVHFGQLYAPLPPSGLDNLLKDTWPNRQAPVGDLNDRWLYVSPDGAAHYLHKLPGYDGGTAPDRILRYSKDSSQLRMRQLDADNILVEHPNGVVSHFERTGDRRGTLGCGGGVDGCWRFISMRDYYQNEVKVEYLDASGKERWKITDSTGRTHSIYFLLDAQSRGGGDSHPSSGLRLDNGDELGDPMRLVDEVHVAAPGGRTAIYSFDYDIRTLQRSRPHDPFGSLGPGSSTIRTPLLKSITVPDSEGYEMSYYTDFFRSGRVHRIQFPTQGKFQYDYGTWLFPTACVYRVDPTATRHYSRTGLVRKQHLDPNNAVLATWKYSTSLHPDDPGPIDGPDCKRADYRQTNVEGPAIGDRYTLNRFFHSVTIGPKVPLITDPIGEWQVTDAGLPYTKDTKIGDANGNYLFLSEQVLDCTETPCSNVVREKYVRFAMSWRTCSFHIDQRDPGDCFRINPVLVRERTVFNDDGGRWIEQRYSGHDGAGHTRTMATIDNFTSSERVVEEYTGFSATGGTVRPENATTGYISLGTPANYLPGRNSSWILSPYTTKLRTDNGRTYRTQYAFNSNGSIVCIRKRKLPDADGPLDLVTKHHLGDDAGVDAGLPIKEIIAGGENGALGSGTCAVHGTHGTNKFEFLHGYEFSRLASTHIAGFPNRFRAAIDKNSGLPSSTFNPADQETAWKYDLLARPVEISPEASLGEAQTKIDYRNPEGGEASVFIERVFGGQRYADEQLVYDYFGRLRREIQSTPIGQADPGHSERETVYDVLGRVTAVTTVQRAGQVNNVQNTTRYRGLDAFGRPSQILRADQTDERLSYSGVRELESTLNLRTSETATEEAVTTTTFDGLGRPTSIDTPAYLVINRYDPSGNVVEVERREGDFSQKRFFGWDNRGLLLWEIHPEIGASVHSGGMISFKPDALGNPREVFDGRITLTHEYDGDGRLLKKREGARVWEEHFWADDNVGSDYRKGKVYESIRHNYPGGAADWAIAETYVYRGKMGRMSKRTTQLRWLHNNHPSSIFAHTFEQEWTYNVLGEVVEQTYPTCITTPQTGRRFCNDPFDEQAPAHTVTRTMDQRLPVAVSSSLGMSADYTYHWNYQLSGVDYSNGASTEFTQGTRGIRRPARIRHRNGNGFVVFDSGIYRYDDAGNIWEIGPDKYTYDKVSRLTRGTARDPSRWEEYLYDPADNLVRIEREDGTVVHHDINVNKNRRVGEEGSSPNTFYDGAGNFDFLGPAADPFFDLDHDGLNMISRFYRKLPQGEFLYAYAPGNYRLITMDTSTGDRWWAFRDTDGTILREHRTQGFGHYRSPSQPGETWEFRKDYVHGPGGLIATRDGSGVQRFFHQDHVGSPRVVTDGQGNQVGAQDYYPYGSEALSWGAEDPHSKYAGHELDSHGVMYYMLGRSYVHSWGRFANVDPLRSDWNLYGYARANPIKYIDPTGRSISPAEEGLVAVGFTAVGLAATAGVVTLTPPVAVAVGAGSLILGVDTVAREMIYPQAVSQQEIKETAKTSLGAIDQGMEQTRGEIRDAEGQLNFLAAEQRSFEAHAQGVAPRASDRATVNRGIFSGEFNPSNDLAGSRERSASQQQRLERQRGALQRQQDLRDRVERSASDALFQ